MTLIFIILYTFLQYLLGKQFNEEIVEKHSPDDLSQEALLHAEIYLLISCHITRTDLYNAHVCNTCCGGSSGK